MKPTHRLKVLNKTNERKAVAGAGWENKDGSITIQLNPCVVLDDAAHILITLFPVDKETTP